MAQEMTQTSMAKPIKPYLGNPYIQAVLPMNAYGRQILVYNGNPVIVARGPGKKVRIG